MKLCISVGLLNVKVGFVCREMKTLFEFMLAEPTCDSAAEGEGEGGGLGEGLGGFVGEGLGVLVGEGLGDDGEGLGVLVGEGEGLGVDGEGEGGLLLLLGEGVGLGVDGEGEGGLLLLLGEGVGLGVDGEGLGAGPVERQTEGCPLHVNPGCIWQLRQPGEGLLPASQVSAPTISPSPQVGLHTP